MVIKLELTGIVQGVGFRPFAKREAIALGIRGHVLNKGSAVEIVAAGDEEALNNYIRCLIYHPPAGSFIADYNKEILSDETDVFSPFKILKSDKTCVSPLFISPDIATCKKCEEEFNNPSDRRYKHPFISCAVCGPRYSVIKEMPYDRCNTVMDKFKMCGKCENEYSDISDRRCFAQTVACHECGPKLYFISKDGSGANPLDSAVNALRLQKVIAVKDIGGFHFACLANSESAVGQLREIKKRRQKPFAVMFKDIDEVCEYCRLNDEERLALQSPARPIVLLKKKKEFSSSGCKSSSYIGAMLACNPVQTALLQKCSPLIMTSGNVTEEPIITHNDEMLKMYADTPEIYGVLYHDRDILTPLDDSIVRCICGKVQITRRARGFVPLPIKLECESTEIFAAGADLKSSFCYFKDGYAYMSQYLGDLENENSYKIYRDTVKRLGSLLGAKPQISVCDMHPAYLTSRFKTPDFKVQHHHAHILSVIAEHNISGDILGFAFDGTGFGTDGTVWGSEVLLCNGTDFTRLEHLKPVKMCGGDRVSKDALRVLECYKASVGKSDDKMLCAALENNINTAVYSSMGRLFDAVSAILGICTYNSYEGECASKLEAAAEKGSEILPLSFDYDAAKLLSDIDTLLKSGKSVNDIALSFHHALSQTILDTANRHGIKQIALSGGVFANRLLTETAVSLLEKNGYNVYMNEKVPFNDGGIALGQIYFAGKRG